jgi:L-serine dehydratase
MHKMEQISVFDIFKIGVGPSSSHTMGPWEAARLFLDEIDCSQISSLEVELFGSLSKTGKGHGTDIAVMLGLAGYSPKSINTNEIDSIISKIELSNAILINGTSSEIGFNPKRDIIFNNEKLPFHPNGITFQGTLVNGTIIKETYYSIGGGFVVQENQKVNATQGESLPFPIESEANLLSYIETENISLFDVVYKNELTWRKEEEINKEINLLWQTMKECVFEGCHKGGVLPGGLNVNRRAQKLNSSLIGDKKYNNIEEWIEKITECDQSFSNVTKWVSCFALAVNEENASFGRVVTAPTNGAAGVIPAVLLYLICFCDHAENSVKEFILIAGEIGSLFKKGSTISAAMGGCQAEIGVSSAMAAAGLTHCLGGNYKQVLQAAEIAMEHHLGLTCDPIMGLVQVPCIERNTMGAMKAITASQIALAGNPELAKVTLDQVIKTMKETAMEMSDKFKETSEGGLAVNISVAVAEC